MDWSQIDWNQKKPEYAEVEKAYDSLIIENVKVDDPIIMQYLQIVIDQSNTDEVIFQCYSIKSNSIIDWFAQRNRFDEINFFKYFFNHPNVLKSLPEGLSKNDIRHDTFKNGMEYSYCLDGILAAIVMWGGPYKKYTGNPRYLKELANKVCDAMFENRYEDILVYRENSHWSDWFFDIAWDTSILVIDKKTMKIWVMLKTDED